MQSRLHHAETHSANLRQERLHRVSISYDSPTQAEPGPVSAQDLSQSGVKLPMAGAVSGPYPDTGTHVLWAMKKAREHSLSRRATTLLNHIAELATTPKGCPQSREQMLADWAIKHRTLEMAAKEVCDLNLLTLRHRKGHHVFCRIPDAEIHAMLNPATEPDAENIAASRPMPQKSADPATPGYDNNENKDLKIQNYKSGYSDIESSYEEPEAATPEIAASMPQEIAGSTNSVPATQEGETAKPQEIAGSASSDPATQQAVVAKPQKTDIAGSTNSGPATQEGEMAKPQEIAGSASSDPATQQAVVAKPQKTDIAGSTPEIAASMPQEIAGPTNSGPATQEGETAKLQEIAGSASSDPATQQAVVAKPQKTDIAGSTPEIAASMPQEIAGSDSFNPAIQEGETAKPQKPDFSEAEPTTRGIRSRNASTEGDAAKNGSPPLEEWTSEATAAQQQLQKACPALLQRAPGSYPLGPTPQTVNPKTCFQQTSHPQ